MKTNILIIGGGHAGGMLAITLRKNKYLGSITIVGEEPFLPYQRPPLSKVYLDGKIDKERIYLKSRDYYQKNNIQVLTEEFAQDININDSVVTLKNGKQISYDNLALATGSKTKKIKSENNLDINYLRTIDDSDLLKEQLLEKKSLAIIGGGYIGLEIASIAAKKGIKVSILELENRLLKRSVCTQVSKFLINKHRQAGVDIFLEKAVHDIYQDQETKKIICDDGEVFSAELVVAGIGITPNTEIAEDAGIKCDDGILVNEYCQTSIENIFAIGDCSNHMNIFSKQRTRLESVQNAVDQAKVVSSFISGDKTPYIDIPWFWSDQYNIKLKIIGLNYGYDQTILKGSIDSEKFAVLYFKNNQLIAADTVNSAKSFARAKKLIGSGSSFSDEDLIQFNI